jgi:hypothetical protein
VIVPTEVEPPSREISDAPLTVSARSTTSVSATATVEQEEVTIEARGAAFAPSVEKLSEDRSIEEKKVIEEIVQPRIEVKKVGEEKTIETEQPKNVPVRKESSDSLSTSEEDDAHVKNGANTTAIAGTPQISQLPSCGVCTKHFNLYRREKQVFKKNSLFVFCF